MGWSDYEPKSGIDMFMWLCYGLLLLVRDVAIVLACARYLGFL